MIGIRGRVETSLSNQEDKTKKYTNIMAEKVTFYLQKHLNKNIMKADNEGCDAFEKWRDKV